MFCKIHVLKIFAKVHRKTPISIGVFLNKVAGWKHAALLKKRLRYRFFPVDFANIFSTLFYRTPLGYCFCLVLSRMEKFHSRTCKLILARLRNNCQEKFLKVELVLLFFQDFFLSVFLNLCLRC